MQPRNRVGLLFAAPGALALSAMKIPCPAVLLFAGCAASPPMPAFLRACESWTVDSAVLGETRCIDVYVPPAAARDPALHLPVLYMPDGGIDEDFVHVAEAVHNGIEWGIVRPLMIVGVENTERRRDLTGPTEVAADRAIAPRVGGSAAFRAFVRDELIPAVAARYRTTDERALVGESLAGLFVVETFLLEPELFGTCIAVSPSLWWNDHALVRQAAERLRAARPQGRLYLTSADEEDIVQRTAELAGIVRREAPGVRLWHEPMPEQFHDTIFRAALPKALRTLFAAPPR